MEPDEKTAILTVPRALLPREGEEVGPLVAELEDGTRKEIDLGSDFRIVPIPGGA